MKKLLSFLAVFALLLGLSTVAMATGSTDPAKWDTSVFEIPDKEYFEFNEDTTQTYMTCLCVCSDYLGIYHYERGNGETGEAYFKWMNKWDTMPDAIDGTCFCGVPNDPYLKTVVFWDGVPNLINDLFKEWEVVTDDVYIPDSVAEIAENCFVEGSHITLHFTANNEVALAYALSRGMNYEIVPEPEVVSEPNEPSEPISEPEVIEPVSDVFDPSDVSDDVLLGDADGDGELNMKDVLLIRKFIAKLDVSLHEAATDVNADGSTDMKDVLILRKQIATAA